MAGTELRARHIACGRSMPDSHNTRVQIPSRSLYRALDDGGLRTAAVVEPSHGFTAFSGPR